MQWLSDERPPGLAWQLTGLAAWLTVTFVAALIGSVASLNAADFYEQLRRPDWAPPAAVFGPVWSLLYLMMGTAAWLVWREPTAGPYRKGLVLYGVQLAVNAAWSWLFFASQQGALAMLDIFVLWILVAMNVSAFWRIHRAAGLLMVPYLVWVGFAMLLNLAVWQWNPGLL